MKRGLAWIVAAAVTLVMVAVFRESAFGGRLPLDAVETNDVSFVGTVYEQWAAQVRTGRVPLWFPEFDGGTPLAAAWMYGLLYPGLALFLVLPLGAAWVWTAALHAGFGAAGMATFLRRRGVGAAGCVTGAVLFAMSEHFVGRTSCGHLNLVLPLAWAPWVLWAVDGCVRGERRAVPLPGLTVGSSRGAKIRSVAGQGPALLGLTAGLGLLSGHVQLWTYIAPLVAAFAVCEAWRAADRRGALRRVFAGAAVALVIAAVQIAITGEFLAASAPVVENAEIVRQVSVPPGVLASKLLGAFAGPVPPPGELDFRHEFRGIAGIWAFGLAGWAVAAAFVRRNGAPGEPDLRREFRSTDGNWEVAPAGGLDVPQADRRPGVPGGSPETPRAHGLWLWVAFAVLGLVASMGTGTPLTAWIQEIPPFSLARSPGRFLVLAVICVPILAAHAPLERLTAGLRWTCVAAVCVLCVAFGVPGVRSTSDALHRVDWAARIPEQFRSHRVHSPDLYQLTNFERSGLDGFRALCYVRTRGWAEVMAVPSKEIAWWVDLGAELEPIVRPGAPVVPAMEDVLRTEIVPYTAMGRGRWFGEAAFGVAPDDVLRRMRRGDRVLFLDGPAAPESLSRGEGTARPTSSDPDAITFDIYSPDPGWLLVSMKLYPGWTATIDGEPAELRRGNLAFPAVRVPAGQHVVRLEYGSWLFRIAALASLAALAWAVSRTSRGRG